MVSIAISNQLVQYLLRPRGEPGVGKWSIIVKDTVVNEFNGSFTDWKLTLWGECIDASKQDLLPMPTENDDDDHDRIDGFVSTTTVSAGSSKTNLPTNPSDHINRPVNAKPTLISSATATPTTSDTLASATDSPSSMPSAVPDRFLPHYFPTFGVSKRTQIWIYGALTIIILFCIGLAVYFFIQRRKRLRNARDDYEFDMLDDQTNGNGALAGGKRVRRRAGELYDAFAGESDEELLSEEEGEYKDEKTISEEERGRKLSRDESEKP